MGFIDFWLVVWLPWIFDFPMNIGLRLSSKLTNSYFSEGWVYNHQPDLYPFVRTRIGRIDPQEALSLTALDPEEFISHSSTQRLRKTGPRNVNFRHRSEGFQVDFWKLRNGKVYFEWNMSIVNQVGSFTSNACLFFWQKWGNVPGFRCKVVANLKPKNLHD